MTESQLNARSWRSRGEFWVSWSLPESDREITFNGRTGPTLEVQFEMIEELIHLDAFEQGGLDDGWSVDDEDGKWFATGPGRWNRFEWVDGSWTHAGIDIRLLTIDDVGE